MSAPMSTPIQSLPPSPSGPKAAASPISDDVKDVLDEMEREMAHTQIKEVPPPQHVMVFPQHPVYPNQPGWLDLPKAKYAIFSAIIALFIFHPYTGELLYSKVPYLERFQAYDMLLRALLLAVVIYVILWKSDKWYVS